tara:strand:+ start:351 stop:551 length:201 start_codon:yes stop_codon:yes gene_type:complete
MRIENEKLPVSPKYNVLFRKLNNENDKEKAKRVVPIKVLVDLSMSKKISVRPAKKISDVRFRSAPS